MKTDAQLRTVSEVARLARVSVRTLHHYDDIGLLAPTARSNAGYRLYTTEDLQRLHQILLFRELGFALDAIRQILDDPTFDRRAALQTQRTLLDADVAQKEAVLLAIDTALRNLETEGEIPMSNLFDGFEHFDHAQYEGEARERWGHTEAYRASQRRTKSYSKGDWAALKTEGEALEQEWARLMAAGAAADSADARALAERHRLYIDRWFYPCSHRAHTGLADMYIADPRFTAHYDRHAPGLAAYVAASIHANAARQGK